MCGIQEEVSMDGKELLGLPNLDGYRMTHGYFLELDHALMGMFPAVLSAEQSEIIVCLDKLSLKKLANLLANRRFKVSKMLLLANREQRVAFDLAALAENFRYNMKCLSLALFTEQDIDQLDSSKVKWASGLLSLVDDRMSISERERVIEQAFVVEKER